MTDQPSRLGCNSGEGGESSYWDANKVQDNAGHNMCTRLIPLVGNRDLWGQIHQHQQTDGPCMQCPQGGTKGSPCPLGSTNRAWHHMDQPSMRLQINSGEGGDVLITGCERCGSQVRFEGDEKRMSAHGSCMG